ncbi:MAG: M28 family peptidase [Fastidiosipilaceae bacterium]|jgi:hypothetical protein
MNTNQNKLLSFVRRSATMVIVISFLLTGFACAKTTENEEAAAYGSYGSDFAVEFARECPYRSPYSEMERSAALMIEQEFRDLGYSPEIQEFSAKDGGEYSGTSQNIIVTIPGNGFYLDEDQSDGENLPEDVVDVEVSPDSPAGSGVVVPVVKRQVIIGAHYDVSVAQDQSESFPNHDGISDNASGVAALLTLARAMKDQTFGYDVVLIAFGAGNDQFAGAYEYAGGMTAEDSGSTDAVYIIGPIYAGDKLYAHAGRNALKAEQKYEMRRKLYQATDVVFEHELSSKNGIDLLLNEGIYEVEYPPDSGERHLYREFTLRDSDYLPFDQMNIPCVYIESGNYDFKQAEQVKDSTHPALEEVEGNVSGTDYDADEFLKQTLPWGTLQKRVNNTAYILLEAVRKGAHNLKPVE